MKTVLADLLRLLDLERLDTNLFRGRSRDLGARRVFGGQVLGQALAAATRTTEDLAVHSLHSYFLRMGDPEAPIIYEVDRQRDGRSFSSRRVVAVQHGRPIFNLAASFQRPEEGFEHQSTMPDVPPPEELASLTDLQQELREKMEAQGLPEAKLPRFLLHERPFDFRPVQKPNYFDPQPGPPEAQIWLRAIDRLPDDEHLHRIILAYVSDYYLLGAAMRPHGYSVLSPNFQVASLDHAIWFQRPFRTDEWLLYAIESPGAVGARGLSRGLLFRRDGTLVAAMAQEGLMRVRKNTPD